MTDDAPSEIERASILAEIEAGGEPPRVDPAPPAEAPPPRPAPKPRSRLARHRRQIAALVLLFVAVLWMSVALGSGSVWPAAIGGTLLAAAALIGLQDLGR